MAGRAATGVLGALTGAGPWSSEDAYMPLVPQTNPPQVLPQGAQLPMYTLMGRNFVGGDGTSKTILTVESKEGSPGPASAPTYICAWALGSQAWTVATIPSQSPTPNPVNSWNGASYGLSACAINFGPTSALPTRVFGNMAVGGTAATFASVPINWGPSSDHAGGLVLHCFADGSVRAIGGDMDGNVYAAIATVTGGENVPMDF